jgi:hypothetical protein
MSRTWLSLVCLGLAAVVPGCAADDPSGGSQGLAQAEDEPEEQPGDEPENTCANVLFDTFDQCLAEHGVSIDDESEEAFEVISTCWIEVANGAFDECCAATPDETCEEGEDDGGDGDGGDGGDGDGGTGDDTCAGVLFAAFDACLADAGSDNGDLDGSGDIDTEEEIELVGVCWIDVANAAFDECCAATPDETCNTGEGYPDEGDGHGEDPGAEA